MASVNKWIGIGNLGKDPEMRQTKEGKAIASFSIACTESWKDKSGTKQESTFWADVTAFDKLAEICGKYLVKGKQVYVEGRLKTDKYEKDGQTRYATKIVLTDMKMLGNKGDSAGHGGGSGASPVSSVTPADNSDIPF